MVAFSANYVPIDNRPPSPRLHDRRDDGLRALLGLEEKINLTTAELALVGCFACQKVIANAEQNGSIAALFTDYLGMFEKRLAGLPTEWAWDALEDRDSITKTSIEKAALSLCRQLLLPTQKG